MFCEVLLPNMLTFSLKSRSRLSNIVNLVNVSRETSKILLKCSLLNISFTHFFTYLSKIDAAAGVIPGNSLASFMLLGWCFASSSLISLDRPEHFL